MEPTNRESTGKDDQFILTIEPSIKPKNNESSPKQTEKITSIKKHQSQPKLINYKEQILKIPKVKQILNIDKYLYNQDIEKRLELIGSVKNDHYQQKQKIHLNSLRKPVEKKNRRHKTNFKIPLTNKNMQSLNNLLVGHIKQNQHYKNQEFVFLKEYNKTAPFDLEKLKFMDEIDQVKKKYKEKYPHFNDKVLSKNKLTLENVMLNRNIKKQIKIQRKKSQKQHGKRVMSLASTKKI